MRMCRFTIAALLALFISLAGAKAQWTPASPSNNHFESLDASTLGLTNGAAVSTFTAGVGVNLTSATPPTFIVGNTASWSGRPAVRFTAASAHYLSGTLAASHSQPYTELLVMRFRSKPSSGSAAAVDGIDSTHRSFFGLNIPFGAGWDVYAGGSAAFPGVADTEWHVFLVEWNGASSKFQVDGGTWTNIGNVGTQAITGITIGANYLHTGNSDLDFGEGELWDGILSDANKSAAYTYGVNWLTRSSPITINAASSSVADVTTALLGAIKSSTIADTIQVPVGTSVWATTVPIAKSVNLIASTTTSIDPVNQTATYNDQTILFDNINASTRAGAHDAPFFTASANVGPGIRISGFTFKGQNTNIAGNGSVQFSGSTVPVRLDHNHFDAIYNGFMINVFNNFGVIDHNYIDCSHANGEAAIQVYMSGYGGASNGDGAFADVAGWGGSTFLTIEDNYDKGPAIFGVGGPGYIDAINGGKYRFRHNLGFNVYAAGHSTSETSVRGRGMRATEVLLNRLIYDSTATAKGIGGVTSGNTYTHDNVISGPHMGNWKYTIFRDMYNNLGAPFYGADGTRSWDRNADSSGNALPAGTPGYLFESGTNGAFSGTNSFVDTGKSWTTNQFSGCALLIPSTNAMALITANTATTLTIQDYRQLTGSGLTYQIHKVVRVLDQPGLGRGTLINGANPSPFWPAPDVEPSYEWNNRHSDNSLVYTLDGGSNAYPIKLDQDVFQYKTSYSGASGVGRGSKASRPAPSLVNTAYWVTDEGTWNGLLAVTAASKSGNNITLTVGDTIGLQVSDTVNVSGTVGGLNNKTGAVITALTATTVTYVNASGVAQPAEAGQISSGVLYVSNNGTTWPSSPSYVPATYPNPLTVIAGKSILLTVQIPYADLNFGNVITGTSVSRTIVDTNSGDAVRTITSVSGFTSELTGSSSGYTVAAGANHNITVTVNATAGVHTGTLTFNGDQTSGVNTITFSYTGVAPTSSGRRWRDGFNTRGTLIRRP